MKLHHVPASAGRRIRAHRDDRHRTVFAYQAPRFTPADDPLDDPIAPTSRAGRGMARLRARRPGSPVPGTVARPLADAAHTLLILRAR